MRQKKQVVIFTFHTTAAAMAMEKFCQTNGLPGRLIPAPRAITSDCGIAWSAPAEARAELENAPGRPEVDGVYEILM